MDLVVFGAGSLGSLLGGLVADAADVTLVGRRPHVDAVRKDGLRITGELERTVHPGARTDPPAAADLAIVTVKSDDTRNAAEALAPVDLDGVLSLQNGLGNEGILAEHLDCEVLAGTSTHGARLAGSGVVEYTGVGEVALGAPDGGQSPLADRVGEVFRVAGIETTVATDMPRRLWRKLAINAGVNPVTALARVPNGAIVEGPGGETARQAAREAGHVARSNGVDLEPDELAEELTSVADATARNTSSMLADVEAGRRTEIDAINGAVVERAEEPVPVNETLCRLVRAWERERDLR